MWRTKRVASILSSVAAAAAALLPLSPGTPFPDDDLGEGLWYYTNSGLDHIEEDASGEGITIALLDTPINPEAPSLQGSDVRSDLVTTCSDGQPVPTTSRGPDAQHATGMASLIVGNGRLIGSQPGPRGVAPGASVLHYTFIDSEEHGSRICPGDRNYQAHVIEDAVANGADIVNLSLTTTFNSAALQAMGEAMREGVIFVAANPNESSRVPLGGPFAYNGVVSVESLRPDEQRVDRVRGPWLTVVAPGDRILTPSYADGEWNELWLSSGTSNATAFTSASLALAWSAHPQASGNEMIRSLVRNTAGGNPRFERDDEAGYGQVSPAGMLHSDPTGYHDVNPLVSDEAEAVPAFDIIVPASLQHEAAGPRQQLGFHHWPAAMQLTLAGVIGGGVLGVLLWRRQRRGPKRWRLASLPRAREAGLQEQVDDSRRLEMDAGLPPSGGLTTSRYLVR